MPPKPKTPPTTPPPDCAEPGGGALARARQFARSRGLPPPQVESTPAAPAEEEKKPAQSPHTKKTNPPRAR